MSTNNENSNNEYDSKRYSWPQVYNKYRNINNNSNNEYDLRKIMK